MIFTTRIPNFCPILQFCPRAPAQLLTEKAFEVQSIDVAVAASTSSGVCGLMVDTSIGFRAYAMLLDGFLEDNMEG
jgi:hypothetical protein